MANAIKRCQQQTVRTHWDEEKEQWYLSIIDIIEILTGTDRSRKYWKDLKIKLKKEESELSGLISFCLQSSLYSQLPANPPASSPLILQSSASLSFPLQNAFY